MNISRRNFAMNMGIATAATIGAFTPESLMARTGAKSASVLNVKDFGAKGDGETPDSQAIQKALDEAGKISGTVYFPSGKYLCHDLKVSANTTLLADPVWCFKPDQTGASLILDDDNADCVLDITVAYGVHVRGLHIIGNKKAEKKIHGIFLNNKEAFSKRENAIVIDDCKIQYFSGHGIYLLRIWLFIIRHSQCYHNSGDGISVVGWDGFVTDNQLSGNRGHGFGAPMGASTIMFTANRIEWNRGYGLFLMGGDAWNITGNCFDSNWGAAVYLKRMRTTTVVGNIFRRCGKDSSELAEGAENSCQAIFEDLNGVTITANSASTGKDDKGKGTVRPNYGMILSNLKNTVITSNSFYKGYLKEMLIDRGGHGEGYVFKNNVGCAPKSK